MNRSLFAIAAAVSALALAACQPASKEEAPPGSEPQPDGVAAPKEPAPAAAAGEIPANFDWHFVAHGGSGDLDFGDGDWAEGASLFHLSCLPNSQNVSISWGNAQPAKLSSGGHTLDLIADDAAGSATDPVFKSLRASGELQIAQGDTTRTLTAKEPGKKALEAFFAYCTAPLKA